MNVEPLLSIVIPTFNRADFLQECLSRQVPIARQFGIPMYVSDNASSDATRQVVERWANEYSELHYQRNAENLGPDKNFELALRMPSTPYVWLLGDTYHVPQQAIERFFERIKHHDGGLDALVFNVSNRVDNLPSGLYVDQDVLLCDLGWHMTCMAALVYSRELIENADFRRYQQTSFLQLGIILEYIAGQPFKIVWEEQASVQGLVLKGTEKVSWQRTTFDIWINQWMNFVFSLPPSYELDAKWCCIRSHGARSGLFGFRSLLSLRADGILNMTVYAKYRRLFPFTIKSPALVLLLLCITPKVIPQAMRLFFRRQNEGWF